MKRSISILAILVSLCFYFSFPLRGQNISDPDPEINQMKESLARGRMNRAEINNFKNKLKSGNNFNEDIGNPPAWSWVRTFGGSGGVVIDDVALDGAGNFYVLATFSDTIKAGTHTFVSQGMRDIIVLKISNYGTYMWGSQLKSSVEQNIYGRSIAIGTGGKVYITGNLESVTATGGSISRSKQVEEEQIFSAGLDNNGNFQWIKFNTEPEAIRIHTDSKGDVYWMTSSVIYKLNPAGDTVWCREIGGHLNDFKISGEEVWISGIVEGAGTVIADVIFSPTTTDYALFLIQMDTTGNYLQRKFIETSYYEPYYTAAFIELDSKGNIYVSGMVYDLYINNSWINNNSMAYVCKFNKDLEMVWILNEDSWNIEAYGFTKSDDNRFYEYGMYYISKSLDSVRIGNITVFPGGDRRYGYYLAEIDSSGKVQRIKTFPAEDENIIVKSPDIIYRAYSYLYDVAVEKLTMDGIQYWKFDIQNTGGSASFRYTMDIDKDGNLYAQGYYRGQIKILNETLKGSGIIFVKFDNDGKLKWWRNMENPDGSSSGIRVDKDQNVYAWGTFNDYIKISGLKYYSETATDIYFIKFDKDGDLKFVKQFDGNNTVVGTGAIDIDQEGNIIIAGTFADTLNFGSYILISYKKSYDIFLSKFDPNGGVLWARSYKGKYIEYARSLAVDEQNNIYFAGYYRDSIAFDSILILRNYGGYDMYITKVDPKGNVKWVKTGGPYNRSIRAQSIIVKNKNLFVLGYGTGNGPFYFDSGNITLLSEFAYNFFLARYDADANFKWVKLIKANNYCNPMSRIDLDEANNVYIGGVFADTLVIEGNLVAGSSGYSYYIAKFDTIGNLKWVKTSDQSNTGDFQLYSLKAFKEDIVLVAGTVYDGIAQVGNYRIVTAGTSSFAGLIGKAIISCVMDLKLTIANSQPGDSTGWAKVSITGGTEPYYIVWSNGQKNTDSIYDQAAGWYQVNVVDTVGCMQYRSFAINDLNGLEVTVDSVHNVSCFGGDDGFIHINVMGGTSPYKYYWSNGKETKNIDNLVAAPYELMVVDFNGLVNYQSFDVSEPKPIDITYDLYPATCGGGTNGRIDLFVSGGTSPYEYEWNTGWMTDSLYGIQAGKYWVAINDFIGCKDTLEIPLSEKGAFIVETDSIVPATCKMSDGQVTIKVLNSVGNLSYTWSTGATTKNLSNVKGGKSYFVYVINQAGCKTVHKVDLGFKLPPENPICLVTVDTATGSNLIVWEKVANAEMYYVFRETTQKDIYVLAGSIPGGALSVFTDSIANPKIRSYRYKIAAVDECGNASILSMLHKTVHLRINQGLYGEINLAWDDYVGEIYESFEVWRYSSLFGWELLETLPANLFSYTDFSVPPGKVYYNVRVPFPNMCYPSGYGKAGAGPYSHSMSNIEDNRFQTGVNEISVKPDFYVYPNPTTGKFYLWSESVKLENPEIQVLDLQGRIVHDKKYADNSDGKISIDLAGQDVGSYIVKVRSGELTMFSKLIIQ